MKVFENCYWLWYEHFGYNDTNTYMLARREFEIEKIPLNAEIKITADSRYKLYVNGEFVHFGPARGYPDHYPFDTIDITKYLGKGKNVLGVIVHQFGCHTFQSIYTGGAGLLVEGKIADVDIGTKQSTWVVKKCPGHRQHTVRRSVQMGFQEWFDARCVEDNWTLPNANIHEGKNGWFHAKVCKPAGSPPWFNFEERGIPLLKNEIVNFQNIIGVYLGDSMPEWENPINLTRLYFNEMNGTYTTKWIINQKNLLIKDSKDAEIMPLPENKRLTLVLDAGAEITGFIGIELEGESGVVVDFTTSEVLKNHFPYVEDPVKSGCKIAISDRLISKEGKTSFETFYMHGFRYLAVTFRNVNKKLKIKRIYVRKIFYPFERKTIFRSSDETLNRIWEMCMRTQENCAFDAYVDCPWREQAQWWGDARIQGKNTFYMFNDMQLLRRGIKQAGESQVQNGLTYGHFPTGPAGNILPDFTLIWIHSHLDYYRYTGEKTLLLENFPQIERAMSFFIKRAGRHELIPPMPEYWVFFDWAPLYKQGYSTVFNLLYLSTLKCMVEICKIAGKDKTLYQKKSESVEKSIIRHFWSEKDKLFYDGYDIHTKSSIKKISQHVHSLAILLDLKKEYHRRFCEDILIPPMQKPPLSDNEIIEASPYFYFYVIEALKKTGGYEKIIIQFIKERWGSMLKQGDTTCWEMWNPVPGVISLCHAWSAHPSVHLIDMAGITPVDPGWKKFMIRPCFLDIDWLELSFPARTGNIEVLIKKSADKTFRIIKIPEGTMAVFRVNREERTLKSGTHTIETTQ